MGNFELKVKRFFKAKFEKLVLKKFKMTTLFQIEINPRYYHQFLTCGGKRKAKKCSFGEN